MVIADAIRDSSKEKLHQELGFQSLKDRRWMRNQLLAQLGDPKTSSGFLYKVKSSKRLSCLYMLRPLQRSQGNQGIFRPLLCRTKIFENIFLPYMINDW